LGVEGSLTNSITQEGRGAALSFQASAFCVSGSVVAVTPERSRLELRDASGTTHDLNLSSEAAAVLAKLPLDRSVEVRGLVGGHARQLRPKKGRVRGEEGGDAGCRGAAHPGR
jgi:hypothetical protein